MSSAVSACNPEQESSGHADALAADRSVIVSIIVPCYNGAAFLAAALTSALDQTHASVEVIVIDDGSTDGSADIARRFPVRYVYQENRGLSEARNTGIRVSTGAYIVFLDADDLLLPDAAATGLCTLSAHPECAMSVGDHAFISADGSRLRKSGKTGPVPVPYEALLKSNFIEMISSVLFRRSAFDRVGMFNGSLRVAEDYDLYLRIARVQPVCFHSTVVAEYRLHGTNLSRNAELMLTTTLGVLEEQKQYVGDDANMRLAFQHGLRSWRRQYGRKLASELAAAQTLAQVDHLPRKLWKLAASYPQGLLMFLLLRLRPAALSKQARSSGVINGSATPSFALSAKGGLDRGYRLVNRSPERESSNSADNSSNPSPCSILQTSCASTLNFKRRTTQLP